MKQDTDWVIDDQRLNDKSYFYDRLHLIESGNEKFDKAITKTVTGIINNEAKASAEAWLRLQPKLRL